MSSRLCIFWMCFLFSFFGNLLSAQVIDSIQVVGMKRTKEDYLMRFLSQKEGTVYDSLLVLEDERRLRTLSSVLDVDPFLIFEDSSTVLKYQINERWTLLPVGDFGASNDNFWIGAGVMESNLFGRGIYLYGYLQYKSPFAAHIIVRDPYIGGSKIGYELQYVNREVLEKSSFQLSDKYKLQELSIAGKYELAFEKDLFFGLAKRHESNYDQENLFDRKNSFKYFIGIRLQRMDYRHFMIDGWQNKFNLSLIIPESNHDNSLSVYNELRLFKILNRVNLAGRLLLGFSTEENTLYQPFIIDSYINFRGSGYRYFRGNQIVSSNLEYRYTVFENNHIGIQLLVFTDFGWIGYRNHEKYEEQKALVYAGPGVRLNIKKIHNAVLSVDYGVSLISPNNGGWVIGWGQYF